MQRYKQLLPTILVILTLIPSHSAGVTQLSVASTQQEEVATPEPEPDPSTEIEFTHVNPEEDEAVREKVEDKEESKVDYSEVCNCWQYVKNTVAGVTSMAQMQPNATATVGAVAIEWFGNVKHVSVVIEVTEKGVLVHETNYRHCQFTERFIDFSSHRLAGFWTP